MSKRISQRDLNLARKLIDAGQLLITSSTGLIDPEMTMLESNWHRVVESLCFDVMVAVREHGRKVSHIEVKGQRG